MNQVRHHKFWREDEIVEMSRLAQAGASIEAIAQRLGRTEEAIRLKANRNDIQVSIKRILDAAEWEAIYDEIDAYPLYTPYARIEKDLVEKYDLVGVKGAAPGFVGYLARKGIVRRRIR